MKRTVIKIDEQLCNGCGSCVSGCHEGALQLIDDKAVMVSDLYCDGLGACIGECPVGAISFEEREAAIYDEVAVIERLAPKGEAAILAHLNHLKEHGENAWVEQGLEWLKEHDVAMDISKIGLVKDLHPQSKVPRGVASIIASQLHMETQPLTCGCPGSMSQHIKRPALTNAPSIANPQNSELCQFPVQLHLINPQAGFLHGADLLVAADCTAFACGDFHSRFLRGRSLVIACPKLDSNIPSYIEKLTTAIDQACINTLTVVVMEVPCCQGLVRIVKSAREQAQRNVPIKIVVLSVAGEVIDDRWI